MRRDSSDFKSTIDVYVIHIDDFILSGNDTFQRNVKQTKDGITID